MEANRYLKLPCSFPERHMFQMYRQAIGEERLLQEKNCDCAAKISALE